MIKSDKMQHTMGDKQRQLPIQSGRPTTGLAHRLGIGDDDLTEVLRIFGGQEEKHTSICPGRPGRAGPSPFPVTLVRRRKRENVGYLVEASVLPVEAPYRTVISYHHTYLTGFAACHSYV